MLLRRHTSLLRQSAHAARIDTMSCKKGKSSAPAEPGNYKCKKCGAVVKKKKKICKPKKIK
jgi:hypothetical protein